MTNNPDEIIEHRACFCPESGKDVSSRAFEFFGKVVEIDFPVDVDSPVKYGKSIESLIGSGHGKTIGPPVDPKHRETVSFQKRITKYKDHVFTFLYHPNVPTDNNGSERAIRNVKVKQKISGQFKILNAAENFAILRSIIDTAIKKIKMWLEL